MKNIELIDKAIDALKGEVCNAVDGYNHQYNFLWLDEVRGYRFTAGVQHYVGEYICKRSEFLARKAERQNKPDWEYVLSKHSNATHIAQWSDGEWMIYTAKPEADICEEFGAGFVVTDASGGNSFRTGVFGKVIGDWRDTLEQRPAVTESKAGQTGDIGKTCGTVGACDGDIGNNGDWHARGELPPPGIYCEFECFGDWTSCFVVGKSMSGDMVLQQCDGSMFNTAASAVFFRPLRTEREKFIEAVISLSGKKDVEAPEDLAGVLYDAGFRQPDTKA